MSGRDTIHHPHDQYFKTLAGGYFDLGADITRERAVHVPAQRIDVALEPRRRVPELGVLDRLFALGPGMFEYFASPPSRADVKHCLRKRLGYEHERSLDAQRWREPTPPEPRLWILSVGRPQEALRAYGAVPMPDWPAGFWQAATDEYMRFVLLHDLPEHPDTLALRLAGRGSTLQRAVIELFHLPEEHPLRVRAWPIVVAHKAFIMQNLERTADMDLYQQALQVYREYEQSIRDDEAQRVRQEETSRMQHLLLRLLAHRFGALSEDVQARVQGADTATLGQWADRSFTAESLDDVFA